MNHCFTRRHFLAAQTMGIGGVALAWLLNRDGLLANPTRPELAPRRLTGCSPIRRGRNWRRAAST